MELQIRKPFDQVVCRTTPRGKSRTKQSHKKECDINEVMKQFERTGQINHLQTFNPQYGDFSHVDDYQTALHQVQAAEDAFADLPARIRTRFHNDPANLLTFMANESNREEAEKLGLIDHQVDPVAKKTSDPTPKPKADDNPKQEGKPPITGGQ